MIGLGVAMIFGVLKPSHAFIQHDYGCNKNCAHCSLIQSFNVSEECQAYGRTTEPWEWVMYHCQDNGNTEIHFSDSQCKQEISRSVLINNKCIHDTDNHIWEKYYSDCDYSVLPEKAMKASQVQHSSPAISEASASIAKIMV